jgi:hypothetical protein
MAPQSNAEIVRRNVEAHERHDGETMAGPQLEAQAWRSPCVETMSPTERSHGR